MARADVFIDGQNFSIACRKMINGYVEPKALARMVAKKCGHELGITFFYDSPSPTEAVRRNQQRFWQRLEETPGMVLRRGRTESNHDGSHREKECDVMLAVDMVTRAYDKKYDRAILIGADTDHAYAVEAVQAKGLQVGWAYLPTQDYIDRLKQVIPADMRIELSEKVLRPIRQQSYSQHRR